MRSLLPLAVALALLPASTFAADAGLPDAGAQPAGCPATAPKPDAPCGATQVTRFEVCRYPEASCHCGTPSVCRGAVMRPPPRESWTWQCIPKVRADGCPGEEPKPGDACKVKRACVYSTGCRTATYPCVKGKFGRGRDTFMLVP